MFVQYLNFMCVECETERGRCITQLYVDMWAVGVAVCARAARRKIVLLYYERSNLPCEFPKWSNVPVKFLRSNVVKFSLRIKNRLPGYEVGRGQRGDERGVKSSSGSAFIIKIIDYSLHTTQAYALPSSDPADYTDEEMRCITFHSAQFS